MPARAIGGEGGLASAARAARAEHSPLAEAAGRPGPAAGFRGERGLPRLPGLDGVRALAVLGVLVFHFKPAWLPGGYLGVEIFFVLSGFLITSLLLAEWQGSGGIDLARFWSRRARRLLPAAVVLIVATLAYALLFERGEVAGLRKDAAASLAYVTNWYLLFSNQPYFEAMGRPSMLQHLWSLAVEEQFYVLWPPLFFLLMRFTRRGGTVAAVVALALGSWALGIALYDPARDASRIYYGTDTRAAALLVGAALALTWRPWLRSRGRAIGGGELLDLAGLAALGGLVASFFLFDQSSVFLYRGGFALVSVTTALLIAAAIHPGEKVLTDLLEVRPLRWAGSRSYALYLWHWPVVVATGSGTSVPLDGWALLGLRVAASVAFAELSYRAVEAPIRAAGFRRLWRGLALAPGRGGWRRRALSLGGAAAVLAVAVFAAMARAPAVPAYLRDGESVRVILGARPATARAPMAANAQAPTPDWSQIPLLPVEVTTTATPESVAPALPTPSPAAPPAVVPAAPNPRVQTDILAVGDSVMLSSVSALGALGSVEVDAAVGRQAREVVRIVQARLQDGTLPPVVVIQTGNNGPVTEGQLDDLLEALAGVRRVVLVNVRVDRPWEEGNNRAIAAAASSHGNVRLVDWRGSTEGKPELFYDDGIHSSPAGAVVYASLIAAAIAGS